MSEHDGKAIIQVDDLDFFYGKFKALSEISIDIKAREITALIGP